MKVCVLWKGICTLPLRTRGGNEEFGAMEWSEIWGVQTPSGCGGDTALRGTGVDVGQAKERFFQTSQPRGQLLALKGCWWRSGGIQELFGKRFAQGHTEQSQALNPALTGTRPVFFLILESCSFLCASVSRAPAHFLLQFSGWGC